MYIDVYALYWHVVCKYLKDVDYIIPVKTRNIYIYRGQYILIMREKFHSCMQNQPIDNHMSM